ncbi:MAG: uracil-DNA glycosylase [Candidatus Promineofilum sp.]|nr:uracil-DNA glycosylase [Promineifilum sp.]
MTPPLSLLDYLTEVGSAAVFNPYAGQDQPSKIRCHNLMLYLQRMRERRPRLLLLGEALGYRGGRVTGVPFTSQSIMLGDDLPHGLFGRAAGFLGVDESTWRCEATATIIWQTLGELNVLPLLWNAFPYHPHQLERPATNRTPTTREMDLGRDSLTYLLDAFAIEQVIAVGNRPAAALARWGLPALRVRHPAHGGKTAFRRELGAIITARGDGMAYGSRAEK